MTDLTLTRQIDGLVEAIAPAEQRKHLQAVAQVISPDRSIYRPAVTPLLPLIGHEWNPGEIGRRRVRQASKLVLLAAFAETPPTSGPCTARLVVTPPGAGEVEIGTVEIIKGAVSGEQPLTYDLPAGSWLKATVIAANGASGVSISTSEEVL